MRLALCLLMVALLLPAQSIAAQAPDALPLPPPVAIDDPAGDLQGVVPAEGAGFIDLVHAEARPEEAGLAFHVTVADLTTDAASGVQWELWLDLEYRGAVFHLVVLAQTSADVPDDVRTRIWGTRTALLQRMDGEAFPTELARVPAFLDAATRTWNATVPWDALVEPGGASPQPGEPVRLREVAALWDATLVSSPHQGMPVSLQGTSASDVAVFTEGTFLTVPGAVGDLALSTPLPLRTSNGEATTFHWPVLVTNRGERDLDVAFTFTAAGAQGRVPPGVRLAAGSNATINVFATVPFNHEHGTTRLFPLTAKAGPADIAVLGLGVDYPAIPQPAGHHPDLWLHASSGRALGLVDIADGLTWMNTLEQDPAGDSGLLMPREENCPAGPDTDLPQPIGPVRPLFDFGSYWQIPLGPRLAIGLDGRLGETATLDLELVGKAASPPGLLHGRLMLASEDFDGFGPFANRTDPFRATVAVPANPGPGSVPLTLQLPMPASLDLVPPSRVENLVLGLMLCLDAPAPAGIGPAVATSFTGITGNAPYAIRAGAHLQLALDEYHDVVPIAPSAGGLALHVEDAIVHAAPGATIVWRPHLRFPANDSSAHAVRLFGTGAPHARLLGDDTVRGPDATQVPVVFVVPDDALPGQVYDVLIDVTHTQDPARAVALRLGVTVDPGATRDDAAELADEARRSKDAPAPTLALTLLMLALLALAGRKA